MAACILGPAGLRADVLPYAVPRILTAPTNIAESKSRK